MGYDHRVVVVTTVTGPDQHRVERDAGDQAERARDRVRDHVARSPRAGHRIGVFL